MCTWKLQNCDILLLILQCNLLITHCFGYIFKIYVYAMISNNHKYRFIQKQLSQMKFLLNHFKLIWEWAPQKSVFLKFKSAKNYLDWQKAWNDLLDCIWWAQLLHQGEAMVHLWIHSWWMLEWWMMMHGGLFRSIKRAAQLQKEGSWPKFYSCHFLWKNSVISFVLMIHEKVLTDSIKFLARNVNELYVKLFVATPAWIIVEQ